MLSDIIRVLVFPVKFWIAHLIRPKSLLATSAAIYFSLFILARWAGHVARMGEGRGAYSILTGRPGGRSYLEDPDVDVRILLKWIFKKWDGGCGLD
jgi:hypothetical protein